MTQTTIPLRAGAPRGLLALELFNGVDAVAGGIGLIGGGLSFSDEWLERTPFDSWAVPGVILLGAVGGSMFAAAALTARRSPHAAEAAIVAGAVQCGWIGAQVAMLGYLGWLQPAVFALGAATAVAGLRRLRRR